MPIKIPKNDHRQTAMIGTVISRGKYTISNSFITALFPKGFVVAKIIIK